MSEHGKSAERVRAVTAKRQGAKPSGSGRRASAKTTRTQFHLGEVTARRLGVHAALVGKNQSRLVDEILTSWLTRFGQGRELFPADPVDSAVEAES